MLMNTPEKFCKPLAKDNFSYREHRAHREFFIRNISVNSVFSVAKEYKNAARKNALG